MFAPSVLVEGFWGKVPSNTNATLCIKQSLICMRAVCCVFWAAEALGWEALWLTDDTAAH